MEYSALASAFPRTYFHELPLLTKYMDRKVHYLVSHYG